MSEPKACPFCNQIPSELGRYAHLDNCFLVLARAGNDQDAVDAAWEIRPVEDALRAELEAEREKTRALSEALDADRWTIERIAYGGDEFGDIAKDHLAESPIVKILPNRKSYYAESGLPEPTTATLLGFPVVETDLAPHIDKIVCDDLSRYAGNKKGKE